ncbi:hypothetical protein MKW98_024308 [Papaver atlanticum]|uniref:Uncharacterized protein n=1 Tax=Papaver atlanticum TaxID=357466 RepID=A0AAD4SYJ7_9MAGN|nr:hypothetical protein MKW98_024308 [Papaver atlanticum]
METTQGAELGVALLESWEGIIRDAETLEFNIKWLREGFSRLKNRWRSSFRVDIDIESHEQVLDAMQGKYAGLRTRKDELEAELSEVNIQMGKAEAKISSEQEAIQEKQTQKMKFQSEPVIGIVLNEAEFSLSNFIHVFGKTTFSRILLNTLLQDKRFDKVAYLDTDVGQPEFTPPGCLALTIIEKQTPDLTIPCLKTPERSIFYGDTSSKRDPRTYLNNVFSLYDYFRKEFYAPNLGQKRAKPEVPLVINTPGWVKGNGYDALVEMLRYIAPTHMVQVRISTESKNLPAGAFWLEEDQELSVSLIEIASARRDAYNRSVTIRKDASLIRYLKIFAYFRQCFPSDFSVDTFKELAQALTAHRPYVVPISKIKIKHLHCQVSSSEIFYALNGSIVGLAVSSAKSSDFEHETPWCVGLGIVRGIDVSKGSRMLIALHVHKCTASIMRPAAVEFQHTKV